MNLGQANVNMSSKIFISLKREEERREVEGDI